MHNHYNDIRDRVAIEPKWWDEHAVPRYCDFHPDQSADIYATEAVLLLIKCQECGYNFPVCMTSSTLQMALKIFDKLERELGRKPTDEEYKAEGLKQTLAHAVETDEIHYGDPPNACPDGCAAGATMNSIPVRVLQFWYQKRDQKNWPTWVRVPELEREIACEWAKRDE